MAEQHGSLRLRAGAAGGACFVLDLPAAMTVPVKSAPDVIEISDVDDRDPSDAGGSHLDRSMILRLVPEQPKNQPGIDLTLTSASDHGDVEG